MRRHRVVLIAGTTLAMTACGGEDVVDIFADPAASRSAEQTAQRTQTHPGAPTAAPSTTPQSAAPTAETRPPTSTADAGVRVGAGRAVPIPSGTGVESVRVESVRADRVTLAGESVGNRFSGACLQSCSLSAHNTRFTVELGHSGGTILNQLRIDLLDVDDGEAVLAVKRV